MTMAWWARTLAGACIAGVVAIAAAEVASRVEDRLFRDVPLLAATGFEDLFVRDEFGRHGRSDARFGKWHLNEFGFRGPPIALRAPEDCVRIFVMGASETFGLYESPDREYPAVLATRLASQRPCAEVVNTAVVGMTLGTMRGYWANLLARFEPDVVLLYPSPHFFLSDDDPPDEFQVATEVMPPPSSRGEPQQDLRFRPRIVDRLRDVITVPASIQIYRDRAAVADSLEGKPPNWVFREPPPARLEWFRRELSGLVEDIQRSGARVVLLTHATRATDPPREEDLPDLWTARSFSPRAEVEVIVAFDRAANTVIGEVADSTGSQLIDTAADLNGCRACFGDLTHFTDLGAERFATRILSELKLSGGG